LFAQGYTALHFAVGRKEAMTSAVEALLACKTLSIDEVNTNGASALHLCALWGHRDIARQLIVRRLLSMCCCHVSASSRAWMFVRFQLGCWRQSNAADEERHHSFAGLIAHFVIDGRREKKKHLALSYVFRWRLITIEWTLRQ
jgi:hypothetical protein